MTETPRHISDLEVERLLAGELEPERAERVRQALRDAGDDRLDRFARANAELLEHLPPEQFMVRHLRRVAEGRGSRSSWLWWAVPVAAAAALVLLCSPPDMASRSRNERTIAQYTPPSALEGPDEIRIKGARPHFSVYLKTNEKQARRLHEGNRVVAGDVLQLSYVAASAKHGVLVSIDGRGVVTMHLPTRGGSTLLEHAGETPLEHSYELDDAPDFERFFFVTTTTSHIDADAIERAAHALASSRTAAKGVLDIPSSMSQSSLTLRK